MRLTVCVFAFLMVPTVLPAADRPNNPFGVHLMIHDARTDANIENHTAWARRVCGPWGYVKIFEYGITPETQGPAASQVKLVKTLYDRELIPVVRLGGLHQDGIWRKPVDTPEGSYRDIAEAFKRVVAGLPLSDECPLYIEVWNEANLGLEWSGTPHPKEFVRFYMATYRAIRSIGDERIRISPGAMSPGGQYNSLEFIDVMCETEPEFVRSFDYWATHPYPAATPPDQNIHDGTTTSRFACIDLWVHELERLKAHGCDISRIQVLGTETGYFLGHGGSEGKPIIDRVRRADYHLRTFRDYWSQWPEVLGMCIWDFANPFDKLNNSNWVHADSTTDAKGWPSRPTLDFEYVAALAKPTTEYGCVSGRFLDEKTGGGIPDVEVSWAGSDVRFTTDRFGNYILSPLAPTTRPHPIRYTSTSHGRGQFEVAIQAGQNLVHDRHCAAQAHATVTGQVVNTARNRPLPGVDLTIEPGGFSAPTDAEGRFALDDIPHGHYTIVAAKEGFYPHELQEFLLPAARKTKLHLFMGPGSPVAANLVNNGGFERHEPGATTALGWAPIGPTEHLELDARRLYVGNVSQRLTAESAKQPVGIIQWTGYSSIEEGRRYRLQCWAKTSQVAADGKQGLSLAGTVVTNPHKTLLEIQTPRSLTGTEGWTLLTVDFTAPPEAGRVSMEVHLEADSGEAWVDEAAVFELTP